jgi:hypothetical protein
VPALVRPHRIAAGVVLVGLVSGCAASAATPPARPAVAATPAPTAPAHVAAPTPVAVPAPVAAPTHVHTAKAPVTAIDRLTAVAKRRYGLEAHGGVAFGTMHRVARDAGLLRVLEAGNANATRTYVRQQFNSVWYHWHVSRLRILQGSKVVVDTGVPFVVAPTHMTLRGPGGKSLGTLETSIQDEVGFVRYMHRNYPVDVVVRGQGTGHVRSSLAAATNANLPSTGSVTLAGARYQVRSFHETALAAEPVTVWILTKG